MGILPFIVARPATAELGIGVVLSNQPSQLCQWITSIGAIVRRLSGTAIRLAWHSLIFFFRHTLFLRRIGVAPGRLQDGLRHPSVPTAPSEINASPQAPRRRANLARTRER